MIPLRWIPILIGSAAGVGVAAIVSIGVWVGLAAAGSDVDVTGPVLAGVLVGIVVGGYTAGRLGDRELYRGGMAGLGVAAVVVAISLVGGSPAPPSRLALVFGLGLVLGVAGGALAVRRKAAYPDEASSPGDRGLGPEESPDSTGQDAG